MPPAPSARDPRQGPYPRTRRFSTSSDPETAIVKLYGGDWHPSELPPAAVHPRQRRCSAEGLEPGEGREGEGGPRRSQGLRRRACVRHLRQRTLAPTILDILRFLIKRGQDDGVTRRLQRRICRPGVCIHPQGQDEGADFEVEDLANRQVPNRLSVFSTSCRRSCSLAFPTRSLRRCSSPRMTASSLLSRTSRMKASQTTTSPSRQVNLSDRAISSTSSIAPGTRASTSPQSS